MKQQLTVFERMERLLSQKGIHVSINVANAALNTFKVEAKYEGKVIFGVDTNDIEAGVNIVVNEMEEQELFEYSATGNRDGYILATDLADAVLKIAYQTDINVKELMGVSKATFMTERSMSFMAVRFDSSLIK